MYKMHIEKARSTELVRIDHRSGASAPATSRRRPADAQRVAGLGGRRAGRAPPAARGTHIVSAIDYWWWLVRAACGLLLARQASFAARPPDAFLPVRVDCESRHARPKGERQTAVRRCGRGWPWFLRVQHLATRLPPLYDTTKHTA
jgi:hypothetical protein